jgi:hypothetical protein
MCISASAAAISASRPYLSDESITSAALKERPSALSAQRTFTQRPSYSGLPIFSSDIRAVALVHRYPEAPRDETDYFVARQRIAAAREFDKAVVEPLDYHPAGGVARRDVLRQLYRLRLHRLDVILLDAGHYLRQQYAAVADRGVEFVIVVEMLPLGYLGDEVVVFFALEQYAVAAEFLLYFGAAFGYFSSRRSFLNHERILLRASPVRTIFSQSRLGP